MGASRQPIQLNNGPAGSADGHVVSVRDTLLKDAGITPEVQAAAIRESWQVTQSLLRARKKQFFSFEGEVKDEREVDDNLVRLQAVDANYRMLGVVAPRSSQKVEVVHRVVLPEWALPDNTPPTVIEVTEVTDERVPIPRQTS